MTIQEEKAALRKTMWRCLAELKMLRTIHADQSILAASRLMETDELLRAETVLCFVSYGTEISTKPLIAALLESGRKIALPRTTGDTMAFYLLPPEATAETWRSLLVPGQFGILEPPEGASLFTPEKAPETTLCVLPGLAFDEAGHRLGKGKGFYDRYLAEYPFLKTVGFAFDRQVVPVVPAEETDISCNAIVTDLRVIHCKN
ncbi:MAG: 5-formyltetrahydrofolate cyclo-ligase [Treponemataceae bacterium]|nr:5-formyltetrahydrofolate cyclo-ligase [Treponemataceae bacterium]